MLKTLLLTLLFLLFSCSASDESLQTQHEKDRFSNRIAINKPASIDLAPSPSIISLPDISNHRVSLRVAYVRNARFKDLTATQLQKILRRSQQLVKQFFAVDIEYETVKELAIQDAFQRLSDELISQRQKEILDIHLLTPEMRENIQKSIFKTLEKYQDNKANVIDYARPYLQSDYEDVNDFISLSYALTDTLITRLQYWNNEVAADGKPVIDSTPYHQWVWWDSLGYGDLPYDVVITNQLVASAENYDMDVHSSLRGGITAGTTTYNKQTQFNGYVYIMLYPMLNDTELLTVLRQDKTYTEEQLVNYAAALLTHELGHLFLHLGHPFGNDACVMSPTIMLNYRKWYEGLNVDNCKLGSTPDMTPGAVKLGYIEHW